jgi:cell division protein FtsB
MLLILLMLFAGLQYRLWWGEGSFAHIASLKRDIHDQRERNQALFQRNQTLVREVISLRNSTDAIEEAARSELGLIKPGETFYMVIEPEAKQP